jgi:cell division septation protein DedD
MSYPLGSVDTDEQTRFYPQPAEQQAKPRLGRVVAGLAVFVAIGLFAGGLWFAYTLGTRHATGGGGEVPLIRADERPTKVKPQNPGGMEIPDRDKLIYTQKRAGVEHLLPPPEKPLPRPTAAPTAGVQPEPAPLAPAVAAAPAPPAAPANGIAAPAKPQQAAARPGGKTPAATAEAAPARAGGARIQLGSVRSEEAARQEWDRLRRANADLLGSLSAVPVRADLGDKGVFYRIQTGPIADADRVCRELNRRNVGCILAR